MKPSKKNSISHVLPKKKRCRYYYPELSLQAYLTTQERRCLEALSCVDTYAEVAKKLGISVRTVETHCIQIREKFHCKNKHELKQLSQLLLQLTPICCMGKLLFKNQKPVEM